MTLRKPGLKAACLSRHHVSHVLVGICAKPSAEHVIPSHLPTNPRHPYLVHEKARDAEGTRDSLQSPPYQGEQHRRLYVVVIASVLLTRTLLPGPEYPKSGRSLCHAYISSLNFLSLKLCVLIKKLPVDIVRTVERKGLQSPALVSQLPRL